MKQIYADVKAFLSCKIYIAGLSLIALFAYGYAMVHPAIGMDDTAIGLYFEDGMAPFVGRWTIYLLNKVISLDTFQPWMTEFFSIVLFVLAVTLWCVLFWRICKTKADMPVWKYLFVGGIFISCPLIYEVFVFYLHNGICLAYGLIALSLLLLLEMIKEQTAWRLRIAYGTGSVLCLTVALGCYESFAVCFAMGAIMAFMLLRVLYGVKSTDAPYPVRVLPWFAGCGAVVAVSLVFRTVILAWIRMAADLESLSDYNIFYRGLSLGLLEDTANLGIELKKFIMLYYINGLVYLPITVLVVSLAAIGVYALYRTIRQKDLWILLCVCAIGILPVFLCLLEGQATRYRAGQYIPMVGAFAVLLLMLELHRCRVHKYVQYACMILVSLLIYNQCADMNHWFYVEYLKYEDSKTVMRQVAYDLQKSYDASKPIVVVGEYEVPYEIAKHGYCTFGSPEFERIATASDLIDPHLKEKFYAADGGGYVFSETPITSVIKWGTIAFDETASQLIAFWEMHGYSFECVTDLNVIAEATKLCYDTEMPIYPIEGYIRECEDYIVIHLSSD